MKTSLRSILITFDPHDTTVSTDLDFVQKLNDLRHRYPSWHIRGIVHPAGQQPMVPRRPRPQSQSAAGTCGKRECTTRHAAVESWLDSHSGGGAGITAERAAKADIPLDRDVDAGLEDFDDEDMSDGNVVGAAPANPDVGLRVRLVCPPYVNRVGTVVEVKEDGARLKVQLDAQDGGDATSAVTQPCWWCLTDEVVVLPTTFSAISRGNGESEEIPVGLGTLDELARLRTVVRSMESEIEALRCELRRRQLQRE